MSTRREERTRPGRPRVLYEAAAEPTDERVLCSHEPDAGRGCATKLLWMRVQGGIIRSLQTTSLADLVEFSHRYDRVPGTEHVPVA